MTDLLNNSFNAALDLKGHVLHWPHNGLLTLVFSKKGMAALSAARNTAFGASHTPAWHRRSFVALIGSLRLMHQ
jgi:hypothetical protein